MIATGARIGILGGTFDPIHYGHLSLAEAAERALSLTRMFVVTANVPPHRQQPIASPFERFAMVVLAVDRRRDWRASDMELRVEGPSYTSHTLARFRERGYQPGELFFVLGADAFLDIATWHDYPAILDSAHFAVVARPGVPVEPFPDRFPDLARRMVTIHADPNAPADDTPSGDATTIFLIDAQTAEVSGTSIRTRCAAGQSINGLVPPLVAQYIEQHGLYSAKDRGRRASDDAPESAAGRLHGKSREAS